MHTLTPQVVIFILIVQRRGEKTEPKMHKLFAQDHKAMLKARYNTNLKYSALRFIRETRPS